METAPKGEDIARDDRSRDEQKTLAELAQQHDVHPNEITGWKDQHLSRAADVFGGEPSATQPAVDLNGLHAKIGQQAPEIGFFVRRARQGRPAERGAMIERDHVPPIKRQAEPVSISRGSVYHRARPVSNADLRLMRRIAKLRLEFPFASARMLCDLLGGEGVVVGRKHMATLMRRMAITALYRKPNTRRKAPGRTIYAYLLRTLPITRANQVWAMDISFIPMARGFVYLAAVIDWYSRRVLAWRLSMSYEEVYLHAYEGVSQARGGIGRYIDFYRHPQAPFVPAGPQTRWGVLRLAPRAFGQGSPTPQDPLENLQDPFKRTGPALLAWAVRFPALINDRE